MWCSGTYALGGWVDPRLPCSYIWAQCLKVWAYPCGKFRNQHWDVWQSEPSLWDQVHGNDTHMPPRSLLTMHSTMIFMTNQWPEDIVSFVNAIHRQLGFDSATGSGGETSFGRLGVSVQPQKGTALVWPNVDETGWSENMVNGKLMWMGNMMMDDGNPIDRAVCLSCSMAEWPQN